MIQEYIILNNKKDNFYSNSNTSTSTSTIIVTVTITVFS